MEDLIKEAIEYVTPKPVQEQTQAKGKAPAKKNVEEVPVDPYQGQDTTAYKQIGQQLKALLAEWSDTIQTGGDIVSLIPDDVLLVRLFIQKLKLTFPPEKS